VPRFCVASTAAYFDVVLLHIALVMCCCCVFYLGPVRGSAYFDVVLLHIALVISVLLHIAFYLGPVVFFVAYFCLRPTFAVLLFPSLGISLALV
jgi:hypothetical protein